MANQYYISAGLVPIDNSTGATANTFYISAGLVPNDTAAAGYTHKIHSVTPVKVHGVTPVKIGGV